MHPNLLQAVHALVCVASQKGWVDRIAISVVPSAPPSTTVVVAYRASASLAATSRALALLPASSLPFASPAAQFFVSSAAVSLGATSRVGIPFAAARAGVSAAAAAPGAPAAAAAAAVALTAAVAGTTGVVGTVAAAVAIAVVFSTAPRIVGVTAVAAFASWGSDTSAAASLPPNPQAAYPPVTADHIAADPYK